MSKPEEDAVPKGLFEMQAMRPDLGVAVDSAASQAAFASKMGRALYRGTLMLVSFMAVAGVLDPDVSRLSLLWSCFWWVFIGAIVLLWDKFPRSAQHRCVEISLLLVQVRWLSGWWFSPPPDVPIALITGLAVTPLLLLNITLFRTRRQSLVIGHTVGVLMGLGAVAGALRPELDTIHFGDWRIGPMVTILTSLFVYYLGAWSQHRDALDAAAIRQRRLEQEVNTDPLTGLVNRRGVEEGLALLDLEHRAYGVLMIDVDHFKQVNDRYGHDTGDAVLVAVAQVLEGGTRAHDVVGRWGGEEFVIVTPGTGAIEGFAERLRDSVELLEIPGVGRITVSIGGAVSEQPNAAASVMSSADAALYAAKRAGRNCVVMAPLVPPDPARKRR